MRQWFKFSGHTFFMAYVDFELKFPLAWLELVTQLDEEEKTLWMLNQDVLNYRLMAYAVGNEKTFYFNIHDQPSVDRACEEAIAWCESEVGEPITMTSWFSVWSRLLLFWKYEPLRKNGTIIGAKLKSIKNLPYLDVDNV